MNTHTSKTVGNDPKWRYRVMFNLFVDDIEYSHYTIKAPVNRYRWMSRIDLGSDTLAPVVI